MSNTTNIYNSPFGQPCYGIRTIIAVDNSTNCIHSMQFEILHENPDFDLQEAIQLACTDYVKNTKPGWRSWTEHGEKFDWTSFWDEVPDNICESYGFRRISKIQSKPNINMCDSLVKQSDLFLNNIQVTEIVNCLIAQGPLACIDFLKAWRRDMGTIPYYYQGREYRDLLEQIVRPNIDNPKLWDYYMRYVVMYNN